MSLPNAKDLLTLLTLGTARRPLPPEVSDWLEARDAVNPEADDAERLLAAYALVERRDRLDAGDILTEKRAVAPPEKFPYPGPRRVRALELILSGTYPALLDEAVRMLTERQLVMPPQLLPQLLERALTRLSTQPQSALSLRDAGGERGRWLTTQNPAWNELATDFDYATAFATEAMPGRRAALLRRWRIVGPTDAREALAAIWEKESPKNQETLVSALTSGISAADQQWLRARLGPKRKGVRRAILRLLLLAGEEEALNDLQQLAVAALNDDGRLLAVVRPDAAAAEILSRYGGLDKGGGLAVFLLDNLPPTLLAELTDRELSEFWLTLTKDQLAAAARAVFRYPAVATKNAFVAFGLRVNPAQLPVEELALLTAELPQEAFLELFHELLKEEKNVLHYGGLPRLLVLSRHEPWSERISKAFLLQLVATIRELHQLPARMYRDLQEEWKASLPLLDPAIFGWARTHLHSMAERPDAFGKLAAETLQTLNFRRVLWEG